jgi:hypothetical protein
MEKVEDRRKGIRTSVAHLCSVYCLSFVLLNFSFFSDEKFPMYFSGVFLDFT